MEVSQLIPSPEIETAQAKGLLHCSDFFLVAETH